jgi:hypothetical protein
MDKNSFKRTGALAILSSMIVPLLLSGIGWFAGFISTSYQVDARVKNLEKASENYVVKSEFILLKDTMKETRDDVREIRNFLIHK